MRLAAKATYRLPKRSRDEYLELVNEFPLISIHSEDQYTAAQAALDRLVTKGELRAGEELYLDALTDLLAAYEDVHEPIPPASDADLLRHLMEAKAVTQAEVSRATRLPKSSISEVLAGKKPFSRQMIRKLANYFGVHASVLVVNL